MKTLKRILNIIVIGGFIVIYLNACISIEPAPPPSEEELALEQAMINANWNITRLSNPPSLNDFVKTSQKLYTAEEWEIRVENNFINFKVITLGLDQNTWYSLTAPEFPGVTYYYFRRNSGNVLGISITEIYKNQSIANNTTVNRHVENNNRNSSNAQIFLNNGSMFYATIIEETSTSIRYTYPDKYGNMVFVLHISNIQSIK